MAAPLLGWRLGSEDGEVCEAMRRLECIKGADLVKRHGFAVYKTAKSSATDVLQSLDQACHLTDKTWID